MIIKINSLFLCKISIPNFPNCLMIKAIIKNLNPLDNNERSIK